MQRTLLIAALLLSGLLHASGFGLNINSDDAEFHASADINEAFGMHTSSRYDIHASFLHSDENLFKIGFGATNTIEGADSFSFGVGVEAVFADDYAALPLYGKIGWILPLDEPVPQTALSLYAAFAPSVLSFSDADSYSEFRFEVDSEVIDHIHIYAGYRNIDTDYENYDYNFNDGWYGGVKFSF
jgi:hypothetical protein